MKIDLSLPNTDIRIKDRLRYLLLIHIAREDINLFEICRQNNIQVRSLHRAWRGEASYRTQCGIAHTLISSLPFQAKEDAIIQANYFLDLLTILINSEDVGSLEEGREAE